ncbi:MAG: nitrogen fixation NifU-like protein [Methanobacteriota archaeon]|uniref:SUF system NifU family Fe-S cluster assembly protein n=1 Tax=Halorutilus salinus TaxID=2487751 RepID=A0A9Q4C3X1_9EURY|nr:SUF system NifU family Fe-S cluster assembly protein [Halorutilus salinus]MCX2818973.1 SUF system NifU family Fe-S cluster assembly protein [Halorutilus salinus]
MSRDMYRQRILDHYRDPQNYGTIKDPDVTYEDVNPSCGDEIQMYAVVDDEDEIVDVKFDGQGCAISQASASLLTEKVKGMTVEEVRDLETDDIREMLGIELSPVRVKCAVLGLKVLEGGIVEYEKGKGT